MSVNRRTVLRTAAAGSAALALGACAKRESTTPAGVLNVGQISNSVAFFPLFIAEKKGYFTDEKLTLAERPRLGTGAKVAAALKSGSIDLGAGVITDAFNLAKIDDGTRIVSGLVTEYYVDIVVNHEFDEVDDDAPLDEKVAALVNKNIGITGPGSGTEALVNHLFSSIGKDAASDATLVNIGNAATAAIGAMTSGQVDALAFFQPIAQQAEAADAGRIYISPARGDVPVLEGALHGVVFSTEKLLDRKKKDEIAGFQTAMERAHADIHDDADVARDLLGEYLEEIDPAALDALIPILQAEIPTSPVPQDDRYRIAAEFHLESGLVDRVPEAGQVLFD